MVTKLVCLGILESCVSSNAARNVFVPKRDFGTRCAGDFRGINEQPTPNGCPAEDPRQHVEWLASKTLFTRIDLKDGYYQSSWMKITCIGRRIISLAFWRRQEVG